MARNILVVIDMSPSYRSAEILKPRLVKWLAHHRGSFYFAVDVGTEGDMPTFPEISKELGTHYRTTKTGDSAHGVIYPLLSLGDVITLCGVNECFCVKSTRKDLLESGFSLTKGPTMCTSECGCSWAIPCQCKCCTERRHHLGKEI